MAQFKHILVFLMLFIGSMVMKAQSISILGSVNEGQENGDTIYVTLTQSAALEYFSATQVTTDYTISNLPGVIAVSSVTYIDTIHVLICLSGNRTVDYDSNITNLTVTIDQNAVLNFPTGSLSASSGVICMANNDNESIATSGSSIEGSESSSSISVALSGGTFITDSLTSCFTVAGLPAGVSMGTVTRNNATSASIQLIGTRTTDYDTDIFPTVSISTAGYADSNGGSSLSASTGFKCAATIESASVSGITGSAPEGSQNGKILTLTIVEDSFIISGINTTNITMTGAPGGVSIGTAAYISKTQISITLSGNSIVDYDASAVVATFHVKAAALQLLSSGEITGTYSFAATNDAESVSIHWSPAIGTNGAEQMLYLDAIIVEISGGTFTPAGINSSNVTLSAPAGSGISVGSLVYLSRDSIQVNIAYDSTDFDSNVALSVTIKDLAYDEGTSDLVSGSINAVPNAGEPAESLAVAWAPGSDGTEANMNNGVLRVNMLGGTFITGQANTITLSGNATSTAGITKESIVNVSKTSLDIKLNWDGTDYDSTRVLTITVPAAAYKDNGGSALTKNIVLAGTNDDESLLLSWEASPGTNGQESTLNNEIVHVLLSGGTLLGSITASNISLGGDASAIGLSKGNLINKSSTSFDLELNWDGTDFDVNKTLTLSIAVAAYREGTSAVSGNITVPATLETVSITGTITTGRNLETDIKLGGSTMILSLSGAQWIAADNASLQFSSAHINTLFDGFQHVSGTIGSISKIINALKSETSSLYNTAVIRTNSQVLTITLPAIPDYEINTNTKFQVTVPHALYSSSGDILASPQVTILETAATTATIFGDDSVCNDGSIATVSVIITGKPPFTLYIAKDGAHYNSVSGLTNNYYSFNTGLAGQYEIDSLVDFNFHVPKGDPKIAGSARVVVLPLPDNVQIDGLPLTFGYNNDPISLTSYGTPTPGAWSGPGVFTQTGMFYPSVADTIGSPHPIVYRYTDPYGCSNSDTALVNVVKGGATITFNPARNTFCANGGEVLISGYNDQFSYGFFTIDRDDAGLVNTASNQAKLIPANLPETNYKITYWYLVGLNLTASAPQEIIIEHPVAVEISELSDTLICKDENAFRLKGYPADGDFSGNGVIGTRATGYQFDPSIPAAGNHIITYRFQSPAGCNSQKTKTLSLFSIPFVDFTVADVCITGAAGDNTRFINNTNPADRSMVKSWLWNFGDGQATLEQNKDTVFEPRHFYSLPGVRTITLQAVTDSLTNNRCIVTKVKNIELGKKPIVDFTWTNECFQLGQSIDFKNKTTSTSLATDNFHWYFFDAVGNPAGAPINADSTSYSFPGLASYEVKLIDLTIYGCSDTIIKTVNLRPTVSLSPDSSYHTDFEAGRSGWFPEGSAGYSWEFGTPQHAGLDHAASGYNCWYTMITDRSKKEQSWITSPCFDLSSSIRPMVKMDIWRSLTRNKDGAVMQYSLDNGSTWLNVGTFDEGVNWFNSYQISNGPGGQGIGWSGKAIDAVDVDADWVETKHWLDELAGKNHIRFRIAYASDDTRPLLNEGFAVDNIWIGERNRKVLMEHFTNSSSTESKDANVLVNSVVNPNPNAVVDIQYHMNIGGSDPMYSDNPDDASGRLLYYGIFRVPYSFVDGGYTGTYKYDYELNSVNLKDVGNRGLFDPGFAITNLKPSIEGSSLTIQAIVKSLNTVPLRKITVHTVVVEKEIKNLLGLNGETKFESVMRKMLPDAAGTSYNRSWQQGDSVSLGFQWQIPASYNKNQLSVVMFVQDETTREVLQAASSDTSITTGRIDPVVYSEEMTIYPNPATDKTCIILHKSRNESMILTVTDLVGSVKEKIIFPAHTEQKEMNLGTYTSGIYFIRSNVREIPVRRLVVTK